MVECATDGCTTTFEKRNNRHKYCDECARLRRTAYYKAWYYKGGGRNHLKKKHKRTYPEKREEILVKKREEYANGGRERRKAERETPEGQERQRRYDAKSVQVRRERRIKEMLAGGRSFRIKATPVTGEYLTGLADYTSEEFLAAMAEHKVKKPKTKKSDPYAWDGTLRRDR